MTVVLSRIIFYKQKLREKTNFLSPFITITADVFRTMLVTIVLMTMKLFLFCVPKIAIVPSLKSTSLSCLTSQANLAPKSNRRRSYDRPAHVISAIDLSELWNWSTPQSLLLLQRSEAGPKENRSLWNTRRFPKTVGSFPY